MIVDGKAQDTCNLNSAILVSIVHVFFFLSSASITPSNVSWETYHAQDVIPIFWNFPSHWDNHPVLSNWSNLLCKVAYNRGPDIVLDFFDKDWHSPHHLWANHKPSMPHPPTSCSMPRPICFPLTASSILPAMSTTSSLYATRAKCSNPTTFLPLTMAEQTFSLLLSSRLSSVITPRCKLRFVTGPSWQGLHLPRRKAQNNKFLAYPFHAQPFKN